MSLRTRILLLFGAALAALLAVASASARWVVLDSFERLEQREVERNAQRLLAAVDGDLQQLGGATRDWAAWDDLYTYAQTGSAAFVRENLDLEATYANNKLNLLGVFNTSGKAMYLRAYDFRRSAPLVTPPALLRTHLAPDSPLLRHTSADDATTGLLQFDGGVLLLSAQPILHNDRQGPILGTLVWARYLDGATVQELAERTLLHASAFSPHAPDLPADVVQALTTTTSGTKQVLSTPLDTQRVAGYGLLCDTDNQPALLLRVVEPREVYGTGQATALLVLALVGGSGLLLGSLMAWSVDRAVLGRVALLHQQIQQVTATGDVATQVDVTGADELAGLGRAFNRMLTTLHDENQRRSHYQQELEHLASVDPLTGLLNRRAFAELTETALLAAKAEGVQFALLMVDLDYFKAVNDRQGHQAGDETLRLVAGVLRAALRGQDLVARVGGDEFAAVLPGVGRLAAHEAGSRLLERLAAQLDGHDGLTVTASVGVAVYPQHGVTLAELMVQADRALYRAKASGRNQVADPP